MLPAPPDLKDKIAGWSDAELFQIVQHGVRFTGMPAWPAAGREDEAWAMVAFLRRYPNSRYAANAQYWLGEVSLVKGDLQAAGQAFARVTLDYPNHSKVPDALYKLADVERRLGRTDKARAALQQVIDKYPGSSAAKLAERDLKNLR